VNASVVRDQLTRVREQLAATDQRLANTLARLGAIPGWLRVGDPELFSRPGDRGKAKRAADLRFKADELIHDQLLLESQLDDLDTDSSAAFPNETTYGVVLPVRLETRFTRPDPGATPGTPGAKWKLRVRVEPDAIAMAVPPSEPTRREAELVEWCWRAAKGDLTTEAGARAVENLARRVGAPRAAWLLRSVQVERREGGAFAAVVQHAPTTPILPAVVGLPNRLEIWGGSEERPRRLLRLRPNLDAIASQAGLAAVKPKRDGSIPRTWWNSYEAARRVGLAGRIILGEDKPSFEVLLCVGLADADAKIKPADIFRAHVQAGRLGTVAPLTPTNTVDGDKAADIGKAAGNEDRWLDMVRLPKTTAGGLAGVLTGRPFFTGMPEPDLDRHRAANALVRALWPVLWQRSLKDLAGLGEHVYRLGSYAGRHVHPFGPLPVLRIGDLPYGVLPIADFDRMLANGEPFGLLERGVLRGVTHLTPAILQALGPEPAIVGGDEETILRILSKVPTAREYGSRHYPATVVMAALVAAFGGPAPTTTVAAWEEQAAPFTEQLFGPPGRRHSPALHVQPWPAPGPDQGWTDWRESMKRFLDARWGELATQNDLSGRWRDGDQPIHPLARLIRQSLLLTMAEVGRLGRLDFPPQPPGYLIPISEPERFQADTQVVQEDGPVFEVPGQTAELVAEGLPERVPRRDAVVHQFEDVREAVRELIGSDRATVESVLTGVLDSAGQRLDVWYTAIAHRRLRFIQALEIPPVLGAYGWVDNLRPSDDPTPPTTAGLIHAPGYPQALTAAVLRDHALHNAEDDRWKLTLDSATVRLAAQLADQVRAGIHLSEVLGREVERRFPDPGRVLALRRKYPARPEWQGRRVCDGQRVLDDARDKPSALPRWLQPKQLRDLLDALDAYADLLVADALHAVVEGRPDAAAESLEASAGLGAPPELRMLRTRREGATIKTDVVFAIPWQQAWETTEITGTTSPVAVADPAFARWLTRELGRPAGVTWTDRDQPSHEVSLAGLRLSLADALMFSQHELGELARDRLGARHGLAGSAGPTLIQLARLSGLLGAHPPQADPDTPEGRQVLEILRGRLRRLRRMAGDLATALRHPPPPPGPRRRALVERLHRWGLAEDVKEAGLRLAERRKLGTGDDRASADELVRRIRQLVPAQQPLPLVCPGTLPELFPHPTVLTEWLPVMAAVRPALADLEVAMLLSDQHWPAATSDSRNDPWAAPEQDKHGVSTDQHVTVAVGPASTQRRSQPVGLVRLDAYGETVPARRHTSWTAFGYDAPRARAPQAVLIVVPADTTSLLDVAQVRRAVLKARQLARVRAQALTPDALSIGMPLGVVEVVGDAAATLVDEGI
jgi:hypothetical protein